MLAIGKEKILSDLNVTRSDLVLEDTFSAAGGTIKKDFEDYQSEIEKMITYNLSILDELPPLRNFSLDDLKNRFKIMVTEDIQKDKIFEKGVEIKKYSNNLQRYLLKYFQEIFAYQDQQQEKLNSRLFDFCRMFYNSDLPLQYLKVGGDAILVQRDFKDHYVKRLHREYLALLKNRSNDKKCEKICDEHNKWIKPFNEQRIAINRLWLRLVWYIDFNNSPTVNDIFKTKTIQSENLDMQVVQDLTNQMYLLVQKMDNLLDSFIEFKPFTSYEGKDGARAIRKIMELLNITEEG